MDTIENMINDMTISSDYETDEDDDIFVILTEQDKQYAISHRGFNPETQPPPRVPKKPDEAVIKTLVCQSIKKKIKCRFGSECTFAHAYSELRVSPCKLRFCNWQEARDEPCPYIHHGETVHSFNSRTRMHNYFPTEVQPPLPPPLPPTHRVFQPPLPPQYKTRFCTHLNNCPYGSRCNFAHSLAELRK